jgi:hypothetical protein
LVDPSYPHETRILNIDESDCFNTYAIDTQGDYYMLGQGGYISAQNVINKDDPYDEDEGNQYKQLKTIDGWTQMRYGGVGYP